MNIAVYPGTFDPVTHGHLDIIQRAARLVDRLIVGIACNLSKAPIFSDSERVDMVTEACTALDGDIQVVQFDSLVVDFAKREKATAIIRGLRNGSDFDYEYQMAAMNQHMNPQIETIFLAASPALQAVASRWVRDIAIFGGDVSEFTSPAVAKKLAQRIAERDMRRGTQS